MATVHQLLPTLSPRDAVGNSTLELHQLLLDMGHDARLWAANIHHELTGTARPLGELPDDDNWCIYHHSIGGVAGDSFERRLGRRVLVYHNITPIELLERWSMEVGAEITLGRDQLARYADVSDLAVCDSDYNRAEVDAHGYARSVTVPVMFDPGRLPAATRSGRRGRGMRILFVGRLAPNKAQHELVAMLRILRDRHDPDATLHLVGSRTFGSYSDAISDYVEALDLGDAVVVHEGVSDAELAAHYADADVFACVSDHEGFCVPVIEAMHHGLPVVAQASTAVTGTVGDGGLVVHDPSADVMAAAVARAGSDTHLAERMRRAGRRRADHFSLERTRQAWAQIIEELIG